ncbi:unnamed protein product [Lepeophtheirus salmonis]|uniref:(salmon louse) hypothetical protein n=1 Tax=Lepeophtheirus salmonis TaxID=72036 RepID=A0A7R8D7D2_LEPSM|nr:unnamed protein product [Lepeophtheirus salmonis]CAF2999040.1 unnamed protein product [Lepeophtheirus salmonis]
MFGWWRIMLLTDQKTLSEKDHNSMGNLQSSKINENKILTSQNDFDDSVSIVAKSTSLGRQTSEGPESVSILDFIEKVPKFAKYLYENGLRKGDVVHIIIGNRGDVYIPVHATLLCQGVVSISVDNISTETLLSEVQETQAKFVIYTQLHAILEIDMSTQTQIPEQIEFDLQTLAVILWTSEDVTSLGVEKIIFTLSQIPFTTIVVSASHIVYIAEKIVNDQIEYSSNFDEVKNICPAGAHTYPGISDDLRKLFRNLENVPNLTQRSNGGVVGNMEVYIRDIHSGERLGPNTSGELIYRNPDKPTLGYLNRPDETKKFFLDDGWCCSGDMFHYNDHGELFYEGRIKEMLKSNGSHVYPIEIETIIQSMNSNIIEAGLFSKTEKIQTILGGIVVIKKGYRIDPEEIRQFVNDRIDDYKHLEIIILTNEPLPRNPNGKLLRNDINKLACS